MSFLLIELFREAKPRMRPSTLPKGGRITCAAWFLIPRADI